VKLNTIKSVLTLSPGDLARRTGLSRADVDVLVASASWAVFHHSITSATALQLHQRQVGSPNHGESHFSGEEVTSLQISFFLSPQLL